MTRLADYRHSPATRRLLGSLAAVVCPPEASRLGVIEAVIDHTELTMRAFPPAIRQALTLGMITYDQSARLWPPARGRRAGALDEERAGAWFAWWWSSRLLPQRELAKAMKSMLCLAYYEMPEVWQTLDYTPAQWIDKVKRVRLQTYKSEIDAHEGALFESDPLPSTQGDTISLSEHRARRAGR